jgi:hypothetical protein
MGWLNDLFGGSESSSSQQIAPQQLPYLQNLWRGAQNQLPGIQGQVGQYQNQGNQFLGNLGQVGQNLNPFIGPGYAQQQIGAVQGLLNRNLSENLLPQISQSANAAGQLGGSRQGVAQGIALRGTQESLANTSADIYAQDLLRRQNAAQAQGALQTGAGATGLQSLPGLLNLGLSPLAALSQIIGSPTVLGQSQSYQTNGIIPGLAQGVGAVFPFGI